MIAPIICATIYMGTSAHGNSRIAAKPNVTAGFKWASLIFPTAYTPRETASPHAIVMSTQPPFSASDLFISAPATTPPPKIIKIIVPINSPTKCVIVYRLRFIILSSFSSKDTKKESTINSLPMQAINCGLLHSTSNYELTESIQTVLTLVNYYLNITLWLVLFPYMIVISSNGDCPLC